MSVKNEGQKVPEITGTTFKITNTNYMFNCNFNN